MKGSEMDIITKGSLDWPVGEVWALVSRFDELQAWHPEVERAEFDGSEVGATRRLFFPDKTVVERLDLRDDATHQVVYTVVESTRPATVGVSGRITLTPDGAERTSIEWVTTLPEGASDLAPGLKAYYPRRIEHLRAALGTSKSP